MFLTNEQIHKDEQSILKMKRTNGINLIGYISDRGGRKSSSLQELLLEDYTSTAIVIREKSNRPITANWFSEYEQEQIQSKGWSVYTEQITEYKGAMSVTYLCTDKENPADNTHILFYGMYLSLADVYKSNFYEGWNKVERVIWEEAVPKSKLIQEERYILDRAMDQMIDLMSICSTVSRGRDLFVYLLGNDISYNVLNPMTLCFNLLERLEINKTIIDTAIIDDIRYNFLFRYFDFEGSTNHWLISDDKKVDNTIDIEGLTLHKIGFKSKFNNYYIYRYKTGLYVCQRSNIKDNRYTSKLDMIKKLGFDLIYNNIDVTITMIKRFHPEYNDVINQYIDPFGRFRRPQLEETPKIYNIDNLLNMKKHQFDSLEDVGSLSTLLDAIVKQSTTIYSNHYIKLLLERIYYDFEIWKKI